MGPKAGSECILGLRLGLGVGLGESLGQKEVWCTGQGVREVLDQGLWREQQPPVPYVPHKVR